MKAESIARLPGSSHLISSHLFGCVSEIKAFDAKSNSVVVLSEQPMTTIGGESVKEERLSLSR
ncbi:hypothetical protein ACSBR2_029043 [Camellia fascicularis]